MPQDKRLIVTKAVLYKLQRVCKEDGTNAAQEGIYLYFVLPPVVLAQLPELQGSHYFHLPHSTYVRDGRTTCVIVPKVLSTDCLKINKRHGYYDAVVTAEAICKRDDAEARARAVRVANTFALFVVDSRITNKLPECILTACHAAPGNVTQYTVRSDTTSSADAATRGAASEVMPRRCILPMSGFEERTSLSFQLSQGASGDVIRSQRQGQLLFRVGHGEMTAGDICENARTFVLEFRKEFPTAWRYIQEFKLISNKTSSIRFMEVHLPR